MATRDPGKITRNSDGSTTVSVLAEPYAKDYGAVCVNPGAQEQEQIYERTFMKKPLYLSHEYQLALGERIVHPDNFIVSMNGYSRITPEQCLRYGIQPGAYEAACAAILRNAIRHLRTKFQGLNLRLIYGASDMGVDEAIEQVAREFNIVPLGFSCPRFMLYVKDDDIPVYVAEDIDTYADLYIQTLDLLICTGGREHALQHDVYAVCIYNKRVHFIDVLNTLSNSGGVPATIVDNAGRTKLDNAAAAMGRNISFFSRDDAVGRTPSGGDKWDAIFDNIASVATDVCRRKMSPGRKF